MKCNEFKNNITDLFDKNTDTDFVITMTKHMSSCKECKQEYEEMKAVVLNISTTEMISSIDSALKNRIINQIKSEEMKMKKSKRLILKRWHKQVIAIAASAAILFSIFIIGNQNPFVNTARAANNIMLKSITAMESLRSMFISMDVRSLEGEPFDVIGEDHDFIEYKLWKQFSGNKPWRIEKPGRIVTYNGEKQFLFLPNASYALTADEDIGFVEWVKQFFEPKNILESEIAFSKTHNATYKIDKTDEEIILTITADALGDFRNNYLKNKSILGSDNMRIYTFDKKSMLLKTFELFINSNGHSTKVIKINSIAYNIPIEASTFSIKLPPGVEWREFSDPVYIKAFTKISSKKAAKKFFTALHNEDYESITSIWDALQITDKEKLEEIKSFYGGLEIISIGEPFKSGLYPGEFVPYKIKLMNGEFEEHNLALRNDNSAKTWIVDGGL